MQVPQQSVTARARREQIVRAAISVIAEHGYRSATFKTIAAHADIKSTRTISYHFDSRDDLIAAVTDSIFSTIGEFMTTAQIETDSPTEQLAAHMRTTVALNDTHRQAMSALMSIFLEHHPADESTTYGNEQEAAAMSPIERILVAGQNDGSFTRFDTAIMAATIQRSLDGIAFLLRSSPDLDLGHYADELVATFDRATRQ